MEGFRGLGFWGFGNSGSGESGLGGVPGEGGGGWVGDSVGLRGQSGRSWGSGYTDFRV